MTLTFDEMRHEYRFNDVVVPSVTTVLKAVDGLEHAPVDRVMVAGIRGTLVHRATEAHDKGQTPNLVDETRPYFEGYLKFLSDYRHDLVIESIEERVYHPLLQYAGTADRVALVSGERAVIDLKTASKLSPATGPQLAAYLEALNQRRTAKERVIRRYALQLRRDATYRFREYSEWDDMHIFRACLDLYRWRVAHGLGEYRPKAQEPTHELVLRRDLAEPQPGDNAPIPMRMYGRNKS